MSDAFDYSIQHAADQTLFGQIYVAAQLNLHTHTCIEVFHRDPIITLRDFWSYESCLIINHYA